MRHTLFISDLHLEEKTPSITAHFLYFLKHQAPKADAIYILGDFFEAWIGDDNQTPFNRKIIESLQTLARTKPTYFMRGNRDFLNRPAICCYDRRFFIGRSQRYSAL